MYFHKDKGINGTLFSYLETKVSPVIYFIFHLLK
jgi:hypothetical protein